MKKTLIAKSLLASAVTALALSATVAQAGPWGYQYNNIGYKDSFNRTTDTKVDVDASRTSQRDYRLNYNLDSSVRTKLNNNFKLDYKYDYRKDDISATQNMNQVRAYRSGVNQNAFNAGGASGHSMNQTQGGTSVGSLVNESHTTKHKGHSLLSPTYTSASGNVSKGNMFGSQIGGTQSAMQMGDVANVQGNTQNQQAASSVSSADVVSNTAKK
ncbi:MAG: hypothetical protein OQK12_12190 [Motiliproteus sp.]|nr:hypothetical protein [Motiliproteus sp.]MCW9052402.1 hypothetical protein [Motiliproteus sp.]